MAFDLSYQAGLAINEILKRYTDYDREDFNGVSWRTTFIDDLNTNLREFGDPQAVVQKTFKLSSLGSGSVKSDEKINIQLPLIRKLADVLCRNEVTDFHDIAHGMPIGREAHGRHVFTWNFRNFSMRVFTRKNRPHVGFNLETQYFMSVLDNDKFDGGSGKDGDTDEEIEQPEAVTRRKDLPYYQNPYKYTSDPDQLPFKFDPRRSYRSLHHTLSTTMENLHKRLQTLECEFKST